MKISILIATMFLAFLIGVSIEQQFVYPQVWNEIHVGMTYDEVVKRVGTPEPYMSDKGPSWNRWTLFGRQELWMYFSAENKVSIMSIKQRTGTENYGYTQTIRYENARK